MTNHPTPHHPIRPVIAHRIRSLAAEAGKEGE